MARYIVRAIQTIRKDSGFDVADHVNVTWEGGDLVRKAFDSFGDYIKGETLADCLASGSVDAQPVETGDETVKLAVTKA